MFRLVQLHPAQTLLVTQVVLPPPLCNSKIWSSRDSSVGTFLKLAKDVLHSSFGLRGMWELSLLLLNSPWDCHDCNQAEVRKGSTGSPKRCRCFWLLPRSNENVSGLSEPSSSSSYYSDCVLFPRLDSEESHSIYILFAKLWISILPHVCADPIQWKLAGWCPFSGSEKKCQGHQKTSTTPTTCWNY